MKKIRRIGKMRTIGSLKRKLPIKGTSARGSGIEGHAYDPETGHLIVTFRGGRRYRYEGVDQKTAESFRDAESQGRFLQANIIGKFDHVKI
jgi:hypothetical protein